MSCEWATLIGPQFRDGLEHLRKVGGARDSQTLPSSLSHSIPFLTALLCLEAQCEEKEWVFSLMKRRRGVAVQYSGVRQDFSLWDLMNGTERKWETVFIAERQRRGKKQALEDKNEGSRVCLTVWERCRGSECVTGSDCLEEIGILTLQHPSVPRKSRIQCLVSHTFSGFCCWNVAIVHAQKHMHTHFALHACTHAHGHP